MIKPRRRRAPRASTEIGWREIVGLPELGIAALRAKIDTGARTSALHAVDLEEFRHDGAPWIAFHVPAPGEPRMKRCKAPIHDRRQIKNTSGVQERRIIVQTTLTLGRRHWHIEVSLADREKMEFDLILGRTAIRRHRLLVNPGKSFLAGPPIERDSAAKAKSEEGLRRILSREIETAPGAGAEGEEE